MDNEMIKDITLLLGVSTPIITIGFNYWNKHKELELKEKELSQKITQSKQQELFEKEIDTYQKLYALTIEYKEQKHKIGSENFGSNSIQYRKDYMLFSDAIKSILNCIEKNIFYVSKELDRVYQELNDVYEMEFSPFYNAREEYDEKELPQYDSYTITEGVESPITVIHGQSYDSTEDGEYLYLTAQEKFYTNNKDKIELILKLIQDEFIKKRDYR